MSRLLAVTQVLYSGFLYDAGSVFEVNNADSAAIIASGAAIVSVAADSPIPTIPFGGDLVDAAGLLVVE